MRVKAYMNEHTINFDFDDALRKTMEATKDQTVHVIGRAIWGYYDDLKDHKVVASKQVWDYFNRLLLLLDSEEEVKRVWRWHPTQVVAAIFLGMFLLYAYRASSWLAIYAYALPFGLGSILLSWLRSRQRERLPVAPFASVSDLLRVRRKAIHFRKSRYPSGIASRTIRDRIIEWLSRAYVLVGRCVLSPLVLFVQMLPERDWEQTGMEMPEPMVGGDGKPAPQS